MCHKFSLAQVPRIYDDFYALPIMSNICSSLTEKCSNEIFEDKKLNFFVLLLKKFDRKLSEAYKLMYNIKIKYTYYKTDYDNTIMVD